MKAISEYLGHYSPDFTNKVYIHQDEVVYDCSSLEQEWELIAPTNDSIDKGDEIITIPFELNDLNMLLNPF